MTLTVWHVGGAFISMVFWLGVGWAFGGWFWLPFAIMCVPLLLVGSGVVYGLLGSGGPSTIQEAKLEAMDRHVERKEDRNDE